MADPRRCPTGGCTPTAGASLFLGLPRPAVVLGRMLGGVGLVAAAYVAMVPFDTAAFGGLTVPTVLASGVADGFNPCAFALLVLFATYTLTHGQRGDVRRHADARGAAPAARGRARSTWVRCGSPTSSSASG